MDTARAPLLILVIGPAGAGDVALAAMLAAQLRDHGLVDLTRVELLEVYQLRSEHVRALSGRLAVLFVGTTHQRVPGGARLEPLMPDFALSSVAPGMSPEALLGLAAHERMRVPPPAWRLALSGPVQDSPAPLPQPTDLPTTPLQRGLLLTRSWLSLWMRKLVPGSLSPTRLP